MPTLPRLLDLRRPHSQALAVLAVLFTLLNAVKPLQVDDGAYYYYARQAAQDPLRPYGFDMFWYWYPQPANEVLAPPVLPYWWSIAICLFNDNVLLWKLWLLPFSLLFVWSLNALFRRFARVLEMPLTWLTVLSPTFLPSLNLMLDVPTLALGLGAVVVFMKAAPRDSLPLAALAGLLAGLSMQTKYTGLLFPVVILIHGFLLRHKFLAILTALLAGLLFVSWELFVFAQHGQSHFLYHLKDANEAILWDHPQATFWHRFWLRIDAKSNLAGPLLPILGGISPAVTLLSLAALRVNRYVIGLLGGLMVLGYVAVAACYPDRPEEALYAPLMLEQAVFGAYGIALIGTTLCVLWMLFIGGRKDEPATWRDPLEDARVVEEPAAVPGEPTVEGEEFAPEPAPLQRYFCSAFRRLDWLLLLWLGLEVAGYFALTPFPAVRRVMGLMVVVTLLAGRRAARTCRLPGREMLVWAVTGGSIALGFMFYLVDLGDAIAEKTAAEQAVAFIRQKDPEARIWYVGHWGFQHYAERAGMMPVVPGGFGHIEPSRLRAGDWLVKPDWRLNQQMIRVDLQRAERVKVLRTADWLPLPLRTVQTFYGGFVPLEHHEGPRVEVEVYRVTEDWVPWRYH